MGLLLVSAMMVIPVAAAQRVTRGFTATLLLAMTISVTVSLTGTVTTYYVNAPSGAAIVLLAIARSSWSCRCWPYPWPEGARKPPVRPGSAARETMCWSSHRGRAERPGAGGLDTGPSADVRRNRWGTAPGETSTAPVRGRSTRQRAAVAAALDEVDEFRSAQELHDMLKHRGDSSA